MELLFQDMEIIQVLFCIKKGLSFKSTSKMIKTNSINGDININIKKEKEKSKKDLNETYLNIYY